MKAWQFQETPIQKEEGNDQPRAAVGVAND